jgi:DNA-binding XRE family transcriptional regulator
MQSNKTSLERAFELARSGKYQTIRELIRGLNSEGYSAEQVAGKQVRTQLSNLVRAANQAVSDRAAAAEGQKQPPESLLTPERVKAARGLLGWSQSDLAARVYVSANAIRLFEAGVRAAPELDLAAVCAALESAGVEFIAVMGGAGVSLRKAAK